MKTKTALALCLIMTAALGAYTWYLYSSLPDQIPTHWNIQGKVDHYGSKNTVLIWPIMPLIMTALLAALPWMSPKSFKIDSFRSTFNLIMVLVTAMMGYLGVVILGSTVHPERDMTKLIFGGIMLFIGILGNLMGKVQRNFFVGIRTPWTLASDKVWIATHRLGARLMTGAGVLGAGAILLGAPPMVVFFVFIAACLYPVLYSLLLYKKLEATGGI